MEGLLQWRMVAQVSNLRHLTLLDLRRRVQRNTPLSAVCAAFATSAAFHDMARAIAAAPAH
jgi:hypothetical protein